MKPAAFAVIVLLTLVAVAHLLRLVLRVEVTVGDAMLPMWVSWLAVVAPGVLAFWLWREQRTPPGPPGA